MWYIDKLVDVIGVLGALLIFNYIKDLPIFHRESILQDKEHKHKHHLQQEAYYRQISGQKMERLFQRWTELFVDMDKMSKFNTKDAFQITQDVFMYGSTQTIKTYSIYMNNLYSGKAEKTLGENFMHYQLYIYAKILSDLKYDFTGYKVDPLDFIKAKINDYDDKFDERSIEIIKGYIEESI